MRRWSVLVVLLVSLGLNAGLVGMVMAKRWQARRPPAGGQVGRLGPLGGLADRIGLAGAERERFFEQQRRFVTATADQRRRLEALRLEVRRELSGDAPDGEKIDRLLDELAGINRDLEAAFVDNFLATRELLSPEQDEKFLKLMARLRPPRDQPFPGARRLRRP